MGPKTAKHRPIAIAGAGIGGLTAALALSKLGLPIVLIERSTVFEEVGAGLQISPNASRILLALGLGPALYRQAVSPERLEIRRFGEPRKFAEMTIGNHASERYGAPFWVMRRADLQTALLDAVRSAYGIRILVGRQVVSYVETAEGLRIETINTQGQSETIEACGLIGADGLRSQVRHAMGDISEPIYRSCEAWRAMLPIEKAPNFMQASFTGLWLGAGCHVVHYPVAAGRLLNLVLVREGGIDQAGWTRAGDPTDIAPLIAGAAQPLRDVLNQVEAWHVWSLFDRRGSGPFAKGPVALLGDAAHPMLPFMAQGAAMAIEDAYVLVTRLSTALRDGAGNAFARAFKLYGDDRLHRTARIQTEARRNAMRYHMRKPFSKARDWWLARQDPDKMLQRYDWLYGWKGQ